MNIEQERAAFEAWLATTDPRKFTPEAYSDQRYKWKGWNAAIEQGRQRRGETVNYRGFGGRSKDSVENLCVYLDILQGRYGSTWADKHCGIAANLIRDLAAQHFAASSQTGSRSITETPLVDALIARWDDDGATRGSAYIELRDFARELERAASEAIVQKPLPEERNRLLRSRAARPSAPEGWRLVPMDPTPVMRKAAADAWLDCGSRLILNKALAAVRAGIDAAPIPSAGGQCQTCNDHGMIGGPSYYNPDEGGEPCPDCTAEVQRAQQSAGALDAATSSEFVCCGCGVPLQQGYTCDKCDGFAACTQKEYQAMRAQKSGDKVDARPAESGEPVARWMHVRGDYVIVSRCDWIYPQATADDAGSLDDRRYSAIGRRDGDIVLCLNGAWRDGDDLATMLAWPIQSIAEQPGQTMDGDSISDEEIQALWESACLQCVTFAKRLPTFARALLKRVQPPRTLGGSKEDYTRVFNMGRDSAQPASAEEAYDKGWRRAAFWANRDDIIALIGSEAYVLGRAKAIQHRGQ